MDLLASENHLKLIEYFKIENHFVCYEMTSSLKY